MTPGQLNALNWSIGRLCGVEGWERVVAPTPLVSTTPGCTAPIDRLVGGSMGGDLIVLETLCAMRDGAGLVIAGDDTHRIQPVFRLVRATAERMAHGAQIVRQQVGCVTVRFESRLVTA